MDSGGRQGVEVGGEVMGTLHGDFGIIPHSPSAFLAKIDPDSFLK